MAARRDLTKKFAREYAGAGKAEKGAILDALVASTGWTRDHARRAIRTANARKGAARGQRRRPRPRKFSYDALLVLQEVWRLSGQPSGKYLAAVMEDTVERLVRFRELGKVADRVTPDVLEEVRVMSAAADAPHLASSVNIGAFNLGNALGAALGGGVIAMGLGYPVIALAGAATSAIGLVAILLTSRRA